MYCRQHGSSFLIIRSKKFQQLGKLEKTTSRQSYSSTFPFCSIFFFSTAKTPVVIPGPQLIFPPFIIVAIPLTVIMPLFLSLVSPKLKSLCPRFFKRLSRGNEKKRKRKYYSCFKTQYFKRYFCTIWRLQLECKQVCFDVAVSFELEWFLYF